MAALQYADVPGYHALIVRRSLSELRLPGNLIELSHQWLDATKAVWNNDQTMWRFPGQSRSGADGATLNFGYLADDNDLARYAGLSFSSLAYDEPTARSYSPPGNGRRRISCRGTASTSSSGRRT